LTIEREGSELHGLLAIVVGPEAAAPGLVAVQGGEFSVSSLLMRNNCPGLGISHVQAYIEGSIGDVHGTWRKQQRGVSIHSVLEVIEELIDGDFHPFSPRDLAFVSGVPLGNCGLVLVVLITALFRAAPPVALSSPMATATTTTTTATATATPTPSTTAAMFLSVH